MQTEAARWAQALLMTTDRYRRGYMVRGTWRVHVQAIWQRIRRERLEYPVRRILMKHRSSR